MQVRLMKKKDINDVTKIIVDAFKKESKLKRWDIAIAEKYVNIIYRISKDVCFVATDKEKIIGISLNEILPQCSVQILKLSMFVVEEKYRRNKIASRLIKKAIEKANKKYNIETVEVGLETITNFPIMWFERLGFNKKENYEILRGKIKEVVNFF